MNHDELTSMKKSRRKKIAFTLIEVSIAALVFAISLGGILITQNKARIQAENNLIEYTAIRYLNGILDVIQKYPYHDDEGGAYDTLNATQMFALHVGGFTNYSNTQSGIYDDNLSALVTALPESSMSLRYQSTVPNTHGGVNPLSARLKAQAEDPFRSLPEADNLRLLGPENGDAHANTDTVNGIYIISESQADTNTFYGNDVAKYYFMDDCDDFDGFRQTIEIIDNVPITYEVSVSAVFINQQDYVYSGNNSFVIPQDRFSVMAPISMAAPPINLTGLTSQEQEELLAGYYSNALFKKITVKASWEYPPGSSRTRNVVLNGGVINTQMEA